MLNLFGEPIIDLPVKRGKASSALGANKPAEQRPTLATPVAELVPVDNFADNDELPPEPIPPGQTDAIALNLPLRDRVQTYLKEQGATYADVENIKQAMCHADRLRTFDFIVYFEHQRNWLVLARDTSQEAKDDLREWEMVFGDGFMGVLASLGKYDVPEFHALGGKEELHLRPLWDFKDNFPHPTPEALEAGIIQEEDLTPANLRALHDEHARELLAVLHDLDAVRDARQHGVDPATGRKPRNPAASERLQKFYLSENQRLESCWQGQMAAYASAFGDTAANAFGQMIRWQHSRNEAGQAETPLPPASNPPSPQAKQPPEPIDDVAAGNDELPVELTLRQTVEQYLKDQSLPYYNFDKIQKCLFSADRLQAFDFAVDAPEQTYLVFADEPEIANLNDLHEWERIFGPGFTALVIEKVPVDIGDEFNLVFRTLDGEKVALP